MRTGAPSLTIAIPFYRDLAFLRTAVESVVEQSCDHWRLIVADDSGPGHSEESVRAVVDSFEDERARYVRNTRNRGMVANWNRCVDLAETDLVTLLHGDDRLLPDYVAHMTELATAHPDAVAFYCGARIIDAAGRPALSLADTVKRFFAPPGGDLTILCGEAAATALMAGNFIMCPTLCFRKSRLGERRFDPEWSQVQDLELTVRLLFEGETLVGSPAVAYAYRRHPSSATATQSESMLRFDEEFRLFDEVAARADSSGWPTTARVARHQRIVKLHLLYRALLDLARLAPGRALRTLRYLASHW